MTVMNLGNDYFGGGWGPGQTRQAIPLVPATAKRLKNGRPDTPEEILAASVGVGGGPDLMSAYGGTNIFDQPQVFPGHNFGFEGDTARAGTWLSNFLFNQLGGVPVPTTTQSQLPPIQPLPDTQASQWTNDVMS